MAQFIKNGPDIPNRFLQAHEGGDVVFFCGAGISRPHLPGFDGLVRKLFDGFGTPKVGGDAIENAIEQERYEVAVELLDKSVAGGRGTVREEIARILMPDKDICSVIHRSLLNLAYAGGKTRIVTTNFDRFFEKAIGNENIECYQAPALPVPKREWSGLVYLHGLLPESGAQGLDDLVISSTDFGRAYILEQSAANFVRELFRNHSVCFVGYSINDPVIRYLLDAFAADRLSGVSGKEMYAFAGYSSDDKNASRKEWDGKGVTPILYRSDNKHAFLHNTLREWADIYKRGIEGKKIIIDRHTKILPPKSDGDFVGGQMRWAIADPAAAKYFASLNPAPPLEWLDVFGDNRLGREDLPCFGCDISALDEKGKFSVINRPTPSKLAPWMGFASHRHNDGKWDDVMPHLANWLLRHLDNPALIYWIAKQGGRLHKHFARMVEFSIKDASIIPPMRVLWRLLLSGRMSTSGINAYDWKDAMRRDGLSFAIRSQLRDALSPRVIIGERAIPNSPAAPKYAKDIVHCEVSFHLQDAHYLISTLKEKEQWQKALPLLLDDFTALLRDTLDIMREVGNADDKHDGSYLAMPSIAEHAQNKFYNDWTALPAFARDAWLKTKETDPAKALRVAEDWQQTPYPIFKRLAFFAATHDDIISKRKALGWLLADNGWWLWTYATKRESIRLMVALAPKLNAAEVRKLTSAILKRPPRKMYNPSATDEGFDRAVWLRLAKAHGAGIVLNKTAQNKLDALTGKYPWEIAKNESDEFSFWGGDWKFRVGDNLPPEYVLSPKTVSALAEWLKTTPALDGWYSDSSTWRSYCENNCEVVVAAFEILAKKNIFPAERWGGALSAWSQGELLQKSWRVAPILANVDDSLLQEIVHSLDFWLREQGEKVQQKDGALFLSIISHTIGLKHEANEVNGAPLSHALNTPVGRLTQGFLRWLFRQDKPKLKGNILRLLTDLCDTAKPELRPGRVMLARYVWNFFSTDEKWTKQNLLPLFDWQNPKESRAVWYGFLRSRPLVLPLLAEIKPHFLQTAQHCDELGDMARQYAGALTALALYTGKTPFSSQEFRNATAHLKEEELCSALDVIHREITSVDERRGEYWRGSVAPYFKWIWPQHRENVKPNTALQIARICTESGKNFPDAVQQLRYFLIPLTYPVDVYYGLSNRGLCGKFPKAALSLLDTITSDDSEHYAIHKLRGLLDKIRQADSRLADSPEYIRLDRICQK